MSGSGLETQHTLIASGAHVIIYIVTHNVLVKTDNTMPVDYIKEQFQKTLDDPCK